MFTGIVEKLKTVEKITQSKNLTTVFIKAGGFAASVKKGDSIAINGVCLTVISKKQGVLGFEVMKETLDSTTIGRLSKGDNVNLEKALRLNGRLDGHIVTGHVDTVVRLKKRVELKNYIELIFSLDKSIAKYIVKKGSVCLDGVSLTVGQKRANEFSVYLIPYTAKVTTLGSLKIGDSVNVEVDILARYVLDK